MPSRPRPTRTPPASRPSLAEVEPDDEVFERLGEILRRAALGLTAALMVARAYWPGEGVRPEQETGRGLYWTLAVLVAAALAAASALVGGRTRLRWSGADGAVYALMALVGVSSMRGAERRTAVNLAWDFVGVGVAYALLRILPRGRREVSALVGALMATAVAVAAYGLFQNTVELQQARDYYLAHRAEILRQLEIAPGSPMQTLYESRLLSSSEVNATFALANSLAGFLVGPAVIGLALGLEALRRRDPRTSLALALGALPWLTLVGCLLLTKSRSAYLGLLLAGLVLAWRARRGLSHRTLAVAGVAVAIVVGGMVVYGLSTRRLDREILIEAGKSLRYRVEYWQGAWDVLTKEPGAWWSGVGPGNFGDAYLRHKRAWASEEIADPHNLILEAWTTAGIGAALALVLALALGLRESFGPPRAGQGDEEQAAGGTPTWLIACAAGGWLLAWPLGGLDPFAAGNELRWLILGVGWGAAVGLGLPLWRRVPVPAAGLGAAALAVAVNLLAAGGLGFAPVALGLWAALALAQDLRTDRPCGRVREVGGRGPGFGLAAVAVGLLGGFVGAITPYWRAEAALAATEIDPRTVQDPAARIKAIDQAVAGAEAAMEADKLSVRPYLQLAELEYEGWQARGHLPQDTAWLRIDTALVKAVTRPRNPRSLGVRRREADYAREILRAHGAELPQRTREWLRSRVADALKRAVPLSPNNATLRGEYAEALADIGLKAEAAAQATEALRLDAIAETAKHRDKRLPKPMRERLQAALPRWAAPPPAAKP